MIERTYRIAGDISADIVAMEVARAWEDLRVDSKLQERVGASKSEIAELVATPHADAISVRNPESGFAAETIVVAFLPVAIKIATDVWEKIILPRIVRRFGADALVELNSKS